MRVRWAWCVGWAALWRGEERREGVERGGRDRVVEEVVDEDTAGRVGGRVWVVRVRQVGRCSEAGSVQAKAAGGRGRGRGRRDSSVPRSTSGDGGTWWGLLASRDPLGQERRTTRGVPPPDRTGRGAAPAQHADPAPLVAGGARWAGVGAYLHGAEAEDHVGDGGVHLGRCRWGCGCGGVREREPRRLLSRPPLCALWSRPASRALRGCLTRLLPSAAVRAALVVLPLRLYPGLTQAATWHARLRLRVVLRSQPPARCPVLCAALPDECRPPGYERGGHARAEPSTGRPCGGAQPQLRDPRARRSSLAPGPRSPSLSSAGEDARGSDEEAGEGRQVAGAWGEEGVVPDERAQGTRDKREGEPGTGREKSTTSGDE